MSRVLALTVVLVVAGCDGMVKSARCLTYLGGNFHAGNDFAFTVDAARWPKLEGSEAAIDIAFLLAGRGSGTAELIHVIGSREIERWKLALPPADRELPSCRITESAETSTCGATLRVLPQDAGGYYYLQTNGDVLEAGMTFRLCSAPSPVDDDAASGSKKEIGK